MPIKTHPLLKLTQSKDQKVWRYIDLYKLFYILEKNSIYFSPLDRFDDIFEGKLPKGTIDNWRSLANTEQIKQIVEQNITTIQNFTQQLLCITCWNIFDHESDALWGKYAVNKYSVCIQTTINSIFSSFENTEEEITIGEVQYEDFNKLIIKEMNIIVIASHKKVEYKDDRELRLFVSNHSNSGAYIKVETSKLIEKIILSPFLDNWECETLKCMISKYGYGHLVNNSEIKKRQFVR